MNPRVSSASGATVNQATGMQDNAGRWGRGRGRPGLWTCHRGKTKGFQSLWQNWESIVGAVWPGVLQEGEWKLCSDKKASRLRSLTPNGLALTFKKKKKDW